MTKSRSSENSNLIFLTVQFCENNETLMHEKCEDLLWPMELMIWSMPLFFLSKKMAPRRLTTRSAFSFSSATWTNQR